MLSLLDSLRDGHLGRSEVRVIQHLPFSFTSVRRTSIEQLRSHCSNVDRFLLLFLPATRRVFVPAGPPVKRKQARRVPLDSSLGLVGVDPRPYNSWRRSFDTATHTQLCSPHPRRFIQSQPLSDTNNKVLVGGVGLWTATAAEGERPVLVFLRQLPSWRRCFPSSSRQLPERPTMLPPALHQTVHCSTSTTDNNNSNYHHHYNNKRIHPLHPYSIDHH